MVTLCNVVTLCIAWFTLSTVTTAPLIPADCDNCDSGLQEIPDSGSRGRGRAEGNGKMVVRYLKKIFYFLNPSIMFTLSTVNPL